MIDKTYIEMCRKAVEIQYLKYKLVFGLIVLGVMILFLNGCSFAKGQAEIDAKKIFTNATLPAKRMFVRTEAVVAKVIQILKRFPDDEIVSLDGLFSHVEKDAGKWNATAIDAVRGSIERYMKPRETAGELRKTLDLVVDEYWTYRLIWEIM